MNNPKGFPLKTTSTSLKSKFTTRFLQSLLRLKEQEISTSSNNICRRSRRIKTAAYSSMALAVGQRRGWSRALIFKLRSRRVKHQGLVRRRRFWGLKKKKESNGKKKASRDPSQAEKLRQLVPGGESMDFCNLLEETAHYIKCLSTQVQVMQKMAHAFSTA